MTATTSALRNRKSKYAVRCCNECSSAYQPSRKDEFFCSTPCRKASDNREMARGRAVVPLLLAWRGDRKMHAGVQTQIARLVRTWLNEDKAAGRTSYQSIAQHLEKWGL
jgi:hypothetical protein